MAVTFTGERLEDSGSLVGDTIYFKHVEVGDGDFTAAGTLTVDGPSGSSTPAVTVIPGGTDNPQLFQASVAEAVGGEYDLTWQLTLDGQTVRRRERYFVPWNDMYEPVLGLLRMDDDMMPRADIDRVVLQVLSTLLGAPDFGGALPAYSALVGADRDLFDRAVALMCAAWIRPFAPKPESTGELVQFASGTDQFKWSDKQDPADFDGQVTIEERWLRTAWQMLVNTTALGPGILATENAARTFVASGRRRNQPSVFTFSPGGGMMVNPTFAMWDAWLAVGGAWGWPWKGGLP
jgi:hypothetical protein